MDYKDFFNDEDVATFKRVKRGQMKIGRAAREVASEMVGGVLPDSGKEFVQTERGMFRLAMGTNSDNTTERLAHVMMGARLVIMGDDEQMARFFYAHGLDNGVARFHRLLRARLEED